LLPFEAAVIFPFVSDATQILNAIEQGDPKAAEQLLPLVYDELRKLAAQKLVQEKPGQTLDATGLVHEAFLRLVSTERQRVYNDRAHFFAAAATAMRHILTDNARRKLTQKHGGGHERQSLDALAAPARPEELIALDQAMRKLAVLDPNKAKLVELRYFAGLTSDEAAEVLGISPSTADRHWAFARAWLQMEVQG
jgi:RNA polymerase sigma factor (TIGR02999 family)